MRKKVFICSPFRGDMEGNARKAAAYCRMACEQGFLPVAPHLLFPQFLNEGIEEERRLGISMGMELLALCDDGELRLTIMATLAQNESKKTSMRVKAGQMVSFQNGVVYGTGNVLGYDKVGPEYVINEVQAKTVRKIFDMYLAGNGSQKIKKQLEKDGDLTAMGKSLWHYATISHILKNRLYCGELEYRKEYVPDYLEQKRAKNNGELDRIIVEGKHQPIVTKEEFERVQKLIEEDTHDGAESPPRRFR